MRRRRDRRPRHPGTTHGATPAPRPRRSGRHEGGQATVELALGFPVVVFGVLLVLQFALVARDQLLLSHAVREAARAASVDPTSAAARTGALRSTTGLDPDRLDVDLVRRGDRVTVEVRYRSRTALPLVGAILPDPTLSGTMSMLEE